MPIPGFISDAEMEVLESQGMANTPTVGIPQPGFISDADMAILETQGVAKPIGRSILDTLGDYGKSAFHGVVNAGVLANTLLNPFDALGAKISSSMTGQATPSAIEAVQGEATTLIPKPEYKDASLSERMIGKGIEMTPMAFFGGGVLPAFASGAGGELTKEFGYGEIPGQIIGGAGLSAIKELAAPFYDSGRKQIVGRLLNQVIGKEGVSKLDEVGASPFGQKTVAEITQSPSMANVEKTLVQQLGTEQNTLLAKANARQAARETALNSLTDAPIGTLTADIRGRNIRDLGLDDITIADDAVKKAWQAVGKTGLRINIAGVPEEIISTAQKLETPLGFSRDANKLLKAIEGKSSLTIEEYQKFRSAAGKVLSDAGNDPVEQALMMNFREGLDNAAEKVANTPTMAGAKINALRDAIDTTREFKQTFKSGSVKEIYKKGEGGFVMNESSIPRRVYTSPEASKQFAKAFSDNAEAMRAARGGLIDEIAKGNKDTWVKNFDKYRPQAKALFGEDFLTVKSVIDDLASEMSVGQLAQQATGRGSITAQRMTAAQFLAKPSRIAALVERYGAGLGLAAGSPYGQVGMATGFIVGKSLEQMAMKSQSELSKLILRASTDPDTAKLLLREATPEIIDALLPRVAYLSAPLTQTRAEKDRHTATPIGQIGSSTSHYRSELDNKTPKSALTTIETKKNESKYSYQTSPNATPTPQAKQVKTVSRKDISYLVEQQHPLVRAMVKQESGGNPSAVSPKGAKGLMQLMPATARDLGVNPDDPMQNLQGGIQYINAMLEKFGDIRLALAAYNYGPGAVEKKITLLARRGQRPTWQNLKPMLPAETKNYVTNVYSNYLRFA